MPSPRSGPTAREIARAHMTEQIKQAARARLAEDGADLSLRAVARDLGVVSSAVYRYFASRDELLTALIIDAYDSMGEAVERAEAGVPRRDLSRRWLAMGREIRTWSLERPHEYALLYGTPVPGYVAPQDTVSGAQRPLLVAVAIVRDAVAGGLPAPKDRLPKRVREDVHTVQTYPGCEGVPATLIARLLSVWALVFGTISFELFGRYNNALEHLDDFYDHQLRMTLDYLGIA